MDGRRLLILVIGAYLCFCSTALAAPITVFYTDFESGLPSQFSGVTSIESSQGYGAFGFGSNFLRNATGGSFGGGGTDGTPGLRTRLTLAGLPQHDSINLSFLLAIIDSWDGSYSGLGQADFFNVSLDGTTIFSETFSTRPPLSFVQTYNPPTGGLITPTTNLRPRESSFDNLGFQGVYGDSAYNMGLDSVFSQIAHTGNTLTLEFFASGNDWQGGLDESWAIDNLRVEVNPVPEPSTLVLFSLGLGTLLLVRGKLQLVRQ